MRKQNFDVDKLRVAAPCAVGWEMMTGDERVRHCHSCELNVYNIAEMTGAEAEHLIANRQGSIWLHLDKRNDETILTKDCPVGLRAYYKRTARFAGAALAAIFALFSVAYSQKSVQVSETTITKNAAAASSLKGKIYDPNGAIIPNAKITLRKLNDKKEFKLKTNKSGDFAFSLLAPGLYDLNVEAKNFNNFKLVNIEVKDKEEIDAEILLEQSHPVTIGIFLDEPAIDTTSSSVIKIIRAPND